MDLAEEHQAAGKHQRAINGTDFPAGIYFCVLKTNDGVQALKLIKMQSK